MFTFTIKISACLYKQQYIKFNDIIFNKLLYVKEKDTKKRHKKKTQKRHQRIIFKKFIYML